MSYHDIELDTTVMGAGQGQGVAAFVHQTNLLWVIIWAYVWKFHRCIYDWEESTPTLPLPLPQSFEPGVRSAGLKHAFQEGLIVIPALSPPQPAQTNAEQVQSPLLRSHDEQVPPISPPHCLGGRSVFSLSSHTSSQSSLRDRLRQKQQQQPMSGNTSTQQVWARLIVTSCPVHSL